MKTRFIERALFTDRLKEAHKLLDELWIINNATRKSGKLLKHWSLFRMESTNCYPIFGFQRKHQNQGFRWSKLWEHSKSKSCITKIEFESSEATTILRIQITNEGMMKDC